MAWEQATLTKQEYAQQVDVERALRGDVVPKLQSKCERRWQYMPPVRLLVKFAKRRTIFNTLRYHAQIKKSGGFHHRT